MRTLTELKDDVLLRNLEALVARDRATTVELLEPLAEVDARRLYLPAGHSSMFAYCVERLHLSEGAAYKRIQAARAGREFPELLAALREGRLHLSAVCVLRPHLTVDNVCELVDAATHLRKSEVEQLMARRFPTIEAKIPTPVLRAIPASVELSPGTVESDLLSLDLESTAEPAPTPESEHEPEPELSPGTVAGETAPELSPRTVDAPAPAPAEPRYRLSLTIGQELHDKLRELQALLSHSVPSGDLEQILERAIDAGIVEARKSRFGAVRRPRARRSTAPKGRHIPAADRRDVAARDGGRCAFVGDDGHGCESRALVQFDHFPAVARGGRASVDGLRLRCGPHNQFEAERAFGAAFMARKRDVRLARTRASR